MKSHEMIEEEIIESCGLIEDQEDNNESIVYCKLNKNETINNQNDESYELIEDKEDNNQLIKDRIVGNDVHQLIKEIIESCESIEGQEDINNLNDYLEIIFNKTVKITFNESPFKSLVSDIR